MDGGDIDNTYLGLAWKLGLHPTILACLSSITSNLEKYLPLGKFKHLQTCRTITGSWRVEYAINMYCGVMGNNI
jgi:hypothetical protein